MKAPRNWSASEESSYFTSRGLIVTALVLIVGGYALKAAGIEPPEWVKDVLLMLVGGILTAYNTRPDQRSSSVELKSEGNPPAQLSATAGATATDQAPVVPVVEGEAD